MHIAFIFSRDFLTANEIALVRGTAAARGVSGVTVVAVRGSDSLARTLERLRATVERVVARQSLALASVNVLADCARIDIVEDIASVRPLLLVNDRVVNDRVVRNCIVDLSGRDLGTVTRSLVLELLHNGAQPDGLGELVAVDMPARDVAVVVNDLGLRRMCEQSVLTLTPQTPAADRRNAAARSVTLLLRVLARPDAWLAAGSSPVVGKPAVQSSPISRAVSAIVPSIRVAVNSIARRFARTMVMNESWEIRYRTTGQRFAAAQEQFNTRDFKRFRLGYDRVIADPFPFAHNGVRAIFFEEFSIPALKGKISCAVQLSDGTLGPAQDVLEKPYHLSYPFVFRERQRVYMIPESAGNHTVDLYECVEYPLRWEFRRTLIDGITATDATLHYDGVRWWMFCTVSANGEYTWDELHLFSADSLTDPWHPHPANPVKRDVRSSRPAGPLFRRHGALIRPAQDCSDSYGGAIHLCEVEELTPTAFRERVIERIDPSVFDGATGIHTMAAAEGIEVVDVRMRRRWRWERDKSDA